MVSTVKNNKVVKKVANKEAKKGPVKKLIKKLDAPPSGMPFPHIFLKTDLAYSRAILNLSSKAM